MFIQVIQGKCSKQEELRELFDRWQRELGPTATGWLGGTYGFTDDDTFVGVVRFDSRDAAMTNSERPEQGEWAERMMALMDGPVEFHDSEDVTEFLEGGSDQAGFVQVIRGRADDPSRLKELLADSEALRAIRPDIIGGTLALERDGTFTETVAFTDEDSAREGERHEPPPEVREVLASAMEGAAFYDLRRPWFASA